MRGYDYSQAGAYFVTVCAKNRECLFGEIENGIMRLNATGRIVQRCWDEIPAHFPDVELDAFVVMPNHVHGIVVIGHATMAESCGGTACRALGGDRVEPGRGTAYSALDGDRVEPGRGTAYSALDGDRVEPGRGTACRAPTMERFGQPVAGSIPTVVRSFKSAVTKWGNESCPTAGTKLWQRNYWEHVVRNEPELHRIREYIHNNPTQWEQDRLYAYGHGMPRPNEIRETTAEYGEEAWMV